jgi:hypothetical protein
MQVFEVASAFNGAITIRDLLGSRQLMITALKFLEMKKQAVMGAVAAAQNRNENEAWTESSLNRLSSLGR